MSLVELGRQSGRCLSWQSYPFAPFPCFGAVSPVPQPDDVRPSDNVGNVLRPFAEGFALFLLKAVMSIELVHVIVIVILHGVAYILGNALALHPRLESVAQVVQPPR